MTAPSGYTVAGSGVLQNPGRSADPHAAAAAGDGGDDSADGSDHHGGAESEAAKTTRWRMKTWRFRLTNVRDVAWGAAPDFRWDATFTGAIPGNPVGAEDTTRSPGRGGRGSRAREQTQWTIRHDRRLVFPFPYPQATLVAGPVGGMEYPMFVMVHYGTEDLGVELLHRRSYEDGHEWFPMIVGSNERRYAWIWVLRA